jgi:hypothetical protein
MNTNAILLVLMTSIVIAATIPSAADASPGNGNAPSGDGAATNSTASSTSTSVDPGPACQPMCLT